VHQRHRDMDPGQGSWRLSAPGDRCPIVHIFDADSERKWITWLWIEHVFHHGSMWLPLGYGPSRPADEAVDCVTTLWLVQRDLVVPSLKFVAAILQSIWPRIST
jgi:hypothetical protein